MPSVNPLRRVFTGSGRLPDDLRAALAAEGVVFLEEGLPGSVTYRNYRAPGQYSSWRKVPFTGAIAITGQRMVVAASRGGPVIAVVEEGDDQVAELADDVIEIPATADFLQPVVAAIPLQLLAYHIAVLRGCDVDKPRNLAKSVTVE